MESPRNKLFNTDQRCFIVAEISSNHGQNINRTFNLIREAKKSGADAVKFQAYTPDTLTMNFTTKYFKIKHSEWGGRNLYELYRKGYMPWRWLKKLKKVADDLGIIFFCTSFDKSSVDFLEALEVPFHKIASFELNDLPLIEYAAKTKKPLILSTGMASLSEIKEAVSTARRAGSKDIILLKCISAYPAYPGYFNLMTLVDMKKRLGVSVGISDHTTANEVSIAAVALGARMVEKHFTLSRKKNTLDAFFSTSAQEFKKLVHSIRTAEKALGKVFYGPCANEKVNLIFRRSIFVIKDIPQGKVIDSFDVRSIRPGYGAAPKFLKSVIGRKAKRYLKKGTPLLLKYVQ